MLHNGKVELVLEELELYSGGEISPSRKTYITNVASFLKRNLGCPFERISNCATLTREEVDYLDSIWDTLPSPGDPLPYGW